MTRIKTHSVGPGVTRAIVCILCTLSQAKMSFIQNLQGSFNCLYFKAFKREIRSALLVSPTTWSLTSPDLKNNMVGMLRIPNRFERVGLLSTSTFAMRTVVPCSLAISSKTGAIIRHGPHQVAQKSTSTGTFEALTV